MLFILQVSILSEQTTIHVFKSSPTTLFCVVVAGQVSVVTLLDMDRVSDLEE